MNPTFRPAGAADHSSTRKLVDEAFSPEDVVTFLDALRNDGCILGEWVADDADEVIGHIVFSRVWVETNDGTRLNAVVLTPLAVRPTYQRTGVGTRLMEYALKVLEARGETLFFVLGHPDYYPRVGFSSTAAERISSPWSGNEAFMVRGDDIPEGKLAMPSVIADAH